MVNGQANKTVTRSFRIHESAMSGLQEDSDRFGVSVNTILNQVLLFYTLKGQERYQWLVSELGAEHEAKE